jgi:hypothetical protein
MSSKSDSSGKLIFLIVEKLATNEDEDPGRNSEDAKNDRHHLATETGEGGVIDPGKHNN